MKRRFKGMFEQTFRNIDDVLGLRLISALFESGGLGVGE